MNERRAGRDDVVVVPDEAQEVRDVPPPASTEVRADDDVTSIDDEVTDAEGADDESAPDDAADLIAGEIDQLAAERDQFRDIAQRLQADFENYRKRVGSQSAADADRAAAKLAEALLPVLDATEAAYLRHPDEIGPLLNLMLAELRKHGLEALDLHEQPFDPNLADAVAHEPGESGETGDVIVAEVLRSGYRWKGRTLRPAMVRTRG